MKKYKVSFKGWSIIEIEVRANSLEHALKIGEANLLNPFRKDVCWVDGKFVVDGVLEADFKEPKL